MAQRVIYLQYLKVIAIVLVLLAHCCHMVPRVNVSLVLISTIAFTGVPIFFAVNGALLLNKEFNIQKHIHKIFKFFIICNIWAIIVGVINYIEYKPNIVFSLKWIILYFLGYTNIPNTGHLWFLRVLVGLYILFPAIKLVFDYYYKYLLIFIIIIFLGHFCRNSLNAILSLFKVDLNIYSEFYAILPDKISSAVFFFCLGGVIHKTYFNNGNKKRKLIKF